MEKVKRIIFQLTAAALVLSLAGCAEPGAATEPAAEVNVRPAELPDRESKIPPAQMKMTPEADQFPPVSHSDEYEEPVPLPYPVNTAGAEDSGFMMPDGNTLYLWFTPEPGAPLEKQLEDGVTGIYVSRKVNGVWQKPERVILQDPKKQSLDGCEFIHDDTMWFCTARTGYTGLHWFKARYIDGQWAEWENADFNPEYEVGELHITADGRELYFHSPREGGKGQYDIWVSRNENGEWLPPQNIEVVNGPEVDGWPSLTQDGQELWFTRFYLGSPAIFRSKRINNEWQEPELIISQFAGESSIDSKGNIYFTHHFYRDGVMLDADIYVAYRKETADMPAIEGPAKTLKGVSLSPRSFSSEDFQDFFRQASEAGDIVTWAGDWSELSIRDGAPKLVTELSLTYDYIPLMELTVHSDGKPNRPLTSDTLDEYRSRVLDFVETYRPGYIGLGIEINSLYIDSPADFEKFVPFYNELYDAVKESSQETQVFTTFQLEMMKGLTMWGIQEYEPHWEIIDRFRSDLVAFTTYPGLFYGDPSDIPEDHYSEILSHTDKPVAFTEIGWHSKAYPQGWESSEEEQAEFIDTFFRMTGDMDVVIAIWSFIYDQDTIEPFNNMGLLRDDGSPRPGWYSWIGD